MAMRGFRVRAVELMELLSFWREGLSPFHIRSQVRWRLTTHAKLEKVDSVGATRRVARSRHIARVGDPPDRPYRVSRNGRGMHHSL